MNEPGYAIGLFFEYWGGGEFSFQQPNIKKIQNLILPTENFTTHCGYAYLTAWCVILEKKKQSS